MKTKNILISLMLTAFTVSVGLNTYAQAFYTVVQVEKSKENKTETEINAQFDLSVVQILNLELDLKTDIFIRQYCEHHRIANVNQNYLGDSKIRYAEYSIAYFHTIFKRITPANAP
jgi:hypothetical protein